MCHHSSKFLSHNKNYMRQNSNIGNFWHFHTFRKKALPVTDIADFVQFFPPIGLHVGLCTH